MFDSSGLPPLLGKQYMSDHQHDQNANELWSYFQNVVWWVQQTFTTYRKEMKGVEWGPLYDRNKDRQFDTDELERRTAEMMQDPDVTKQRGIFSYLLNGDERMVRTSSNTSRCASRALNIFH